MQKGKFIVFDGNDGSGKATQTKLLAEYLTASGIENETFDFPAYTQNVFGALIGECLAGKHGDFVHLDPKIASPLYALDRLESASNIRCALEAGKVVLSDRYTSANQIHQGGKIDDEEERAAFLTWLEHMEHHIVGVPKPTAVIYLDVPVEISLKLLTEKRALKNSILAVGEKDSVEEDRQYLERSHAAARWLADREDSWHVISCVDEHGLRSPEDIHEEIRTVVAEI